jgi:5-methylcytosine-specific restriction protein B
MSYEDFIEGIKPVNPESEGSLTYEIQPGIFKAICDSAQTRNSQGFDAAYKKLQEHLAKLNQDEKFPLTTPTGKEFSISLNSKGNFYLYTGQDQNRQGVLTKENLKKQIDGEDIWYQGYHTGVLNLLEKEYGYSPNQKDPAKNYVLIIDEINRGNVSQIFGELITLIEDDKRLGKREGISITLPYSKKKFGVPSNVYIIGTMNTADRSVEALDTALRRRFHFIEMPPNPELIRVEGELKDQNGKLKVEGSEPIDLAVLLKTVNQRIEKLLDSDHQIGHSFFLSIDSMSSLKQAFQNKIIPLLKEYFYGDFGKLGLVLGEGFFENIGTSNSSTFANFGDFDSSDFNERVIYKLKTIYSNDKKLSEMNDNDFLDAINKLLNNKLP